LLAGLVVVLMTMPTVFLADNAAAEPTADVYFVADTYEIGTQMSIHIALAGGDTGGDGWFVYYLKDSTGAIQETQEYIVVSYSGYRYFTPSQGDPTGTWTAEIKWYDYWTQRYSSMDSDTTYVTLQGMYTVSGHVYGKNYDQTVTYALPLATVTAKQETSPGVLTGVVYTTTADWFGAYTLAVAEDWLYQMVVSCHDHATSSNLHLGVYADKVQDFTLRCQWKEYPQPWEATYGKNPDLPRLFNRDINGDGTVDSVCLFLDAWLYRGDLSVSWNDFQYNAEDRPAQATFLVELQGFRDSGTYFADPLNGVIPNVVPVGSTGAYYPAKKMVLYIETDVQYGEVFGIPETYFTPYHTITVDGIHFEANRYSLYFCFNGGRYNKALDPWNEITYDVFTTPSGWPTVGNGVDLEYQMNNDGYPDTSAYFLSVSADMSSFSTKKDVLIQFYGDFMMELFGISSLTGAEDIAYISTVGMYSFGYYIDYVVK
jgi:hypothetical protein